jgi:hypothetical protein
MCYKMLKYKILFVLVFIFVVYIFARDSEAFADVKNQIIFDKIGNIECGAKDCTCKNCQWFNYEQKEKTPENIEKLYMKNKGNTLLSPQGSIIWEGDHPPVQFYGDKFDKVKCPDYSDYFEENTCWTKAKSKKN